MHTEPSTEEESPTAPSFQPERITFLVLRFLNRLKVSGRSPHTISAYRNDLNLFADFLRSSKHDPSAASTHIIDDWLHHLERSGRHSQASQRRALMSVRTFMHFLVESGVVVGSPFLLAKSPKQPKADLFCISEPHFRRLGHRLKKSAAQGDLKAARDHALVLVLGQCGLKASEAAGLTWKSAQIGEDCKGTLIVESGHKPRLIPFGAEVGRAHKHLREATAGLTTPENSSVFFGFKNISRRFAEQSMQRHSVKFVVYELCQDLLGFPYNSESLRNRAILTWLQKGWEPQKIAELAGYSSLQSLERFAPPDSTLAHFRRNRKRTGRKHADDSKRSAQADRKIRDH